MKRIVLLLISWGIVAFGQPHLSVFLSILSSVLGFALFFLSLRSFEEIKTRFWVGTLWFTAAQLVQLSWLATPEYQGVYIYFVYLGIAFWLGAEFGVLTFFFPKKGLVKGKKILALAALWTLLEWSRLYILCGFAWNPIGLTLSGTSYTMQLASIGGVFGLSFLVIALNLMTYNLLVSWTPKRVLACGGVILLPYLVGGTHLIYHQAQKEEHKDRASVVLVQPGLLPDQKDYFYGKESQFIHPYDQWRALFDYLKQHREKELDLIVFPEYAIPFGAYTRVYPLEGIGPILEEELGDISLYLKSPYAEKREGKWFVSNAMIVQALADFYKAEVVIGLDAQDQRGNYNAAFHFKPERNKVMRYDKRVLVPLAEYLPFSFLKPLVARYGITHFFTHGKEAKVTEGKLPLSLSVCYEECFPGHMREGRQKGGMLFVNVTNDGWFPHSRLPTQHFMHGRLRAIENGSPLLRACNTGVTAAVDSLGKTVGHLEGEKGGLYLSVSTYSFQTLYTFWGDLFIILFSAALLLFLKKENPLDEKRKGD